MKGVQEMESRRNCGVPNCNIVAIETPEGFEVKAGEENLFFHKVRICEYNIFQKGTLTAIFKCHDWENTIIAPDGGKKQIIGLHICVTNPEGDILMHINSKQHEKKSDAECCKFVAEMMSRWNEK